MVVGVCVSCWEFERFFNSCFLKNDEEFGLMEYLIVDLYRVIFCCDVVVVWWLLFGLCLEIVHRFLFYILFEHGGYPGCVLRVWLL